MPCMTFMWCAGSARPRSLRMSRTYSGRTKNAIGESGGGRYARAGEFTASSAWPLQMSWMRSGVALTTVPRSTFGMLMMRATVSEAGCHRSSERGAACTTRPCS